MRPEKQHRIGLVSLAEKIDRPLEFLGDFQVFEEETRSPRDPTPMNEHCARRPTVVAVLAGKQTERVSRLRSGVKRAAGICATILPPCVSAKVPSLSY